MSSFLARTFGLGLFAAALLMGPTAGADPTDEAFFAVLPHLSAQAPRTVAWGVSGDGTIVVGESDSSQGTQAFRWTAAGGIQPLGDLPGGDFTSVALAVSDDGTVICGASESALSEPNANEAFRWTQADGMVGLGLLDGGFPASAARAASSDGALLAGSASSSVALFQAMRWTQGSGMVGLAGGGALTVNDANGVSDDGLVIVGRISVGSTSRAVRWIGGGAPQVIDGQGPATDGSNALACNSDGSVVVGTASIPGEQNAFVWRESTGVLESIGDLPGSTVEGLATAVSADGSVVVGHGRSATGVEAFVWDADAGMRTVSSALADLGVFDMRGFVHSFARGVSADGRTIVGHGIDGSGLESAWVAFLGEPVAQQGEVLPKKMRVKINQRKPHRSQITVKGMFDQGELPSQLGAPVVVDLGALSFSVPAMTWNARKKSFLYEGDAYQCKLKPSPTGSSRAEFTLKYRGDIDGLVATDGPVAVRFLGEGLAGNALVDVAAGKYAIGTRKGQLRSPGLHLESASVRLSPAGATGKDSLLLVFSLAGDGTAPFVAQDFGIAFGPIFTASVPGGAFDRRGDKHVYEGPAPGLKKVTVDYAGKKLTVKGEKLDLGAFPEGASRIDVVPALGGQSRSQVLTFVRKGRKLQY